MRRAGNIFIVTGIISIVSSAILIVISILTFNLVSIISSIISLIFGIVNCVAGSSLKSDDNVLTYQVEKMKKMQKRIEILESRSKQLENIVTHKNSQQIGKQIQK